MSNENGYTREITGFAGKLDIKCEIDAEHIEMDKGNWEAVYIFEPYYENDTAKDVRRVNPFIRLFIDKEINNMEDKHKSCDYSYDASTFTLKLTGDGGINAALPIQSLIYRLDLHLFYFTMFDITDHLGAITSIVKELHQWHWIDENPNYKDLLLQQDYYDDMIYNFPKYKGVKDNEK